MSRKNKKFTLTTLDIAILTAGRVDLLEKCIDAILPQMEVGYRIHVYNNGFPSDEYEQVYKKLPEHSNVSRNRQNTGFPGGANGAIKMGTAPLCLFISDDIFLHSGAIETLIARMKSDEQIALCGYKFLFTEDTNEPARPAGRVQHVGLATNIRGDIIHPMIGWTPENPKTNISRDVVGVTGASFIVRRDAFHRAGGFNSIYGMGYYEDVDLCLTLRSLGYKVFIDTNAVATHGVGQTFSTSQTVKPNIQQNQTIFKSRWLQNLPWTEFDLW
jgi:GT2 family glycosyltransferase